MLQTLLQILDIGLGCMALKMLYHPSRRYLPERMERVEKHVGLPAYQEAA